MNADLKNTPHESSQGGVNRLARPDAAVCSEPWQALCAPNVSLELWASTKHAHKSDGEGTRSFKNLYHGIGVQAVCSLALEYKSGS